MVKIAIQCWMLLGLLVGALGMHFFQQNVFNWVFFCLVAGALHGMIGFHRWRHSYRSELPATAMFLIVWGALLGSIFLLPVLNLSLPEGLIAGGAFGTLPSGLMLHRLERGRYF
jgi:hypothetical protein